MLTASHIARGGRGLQRAALDGRCWRRPTSVPVASLHATAAGRAGHSKWSKIARGKGALDAERSKTFSKIAAALKAAVRAGGPDPNTNARLSTAIAQAKQQQAPKDVIERALASKSKDEAEVVVFEGVGPSSISVIVECLTDSRKRTTQNVRAIFAKHGGELQATGAVSWNFVSKGQISFPCGGGGGEDLSEERVMEAAMGAGATDIDFQDFQAIITCDADDLMGVRKRLVEALGDAAVNQGSTELLRIPQTFIEVPPGEQEELLGSFLERLDDNEDVQTVTHNAAE